MKETKFNPSDVKCLSNALLIEVFINNEIKVGDKVLYKTDQAASPESYALVHSIGPHCEGVKVGDYILLKPLRKPMYEIQGGKYTFIDIFNVEAVIPKEYLDYFRVKSNVSPSNNLEG